MATQNTKTKTTLADKDKKVLMILGALVILALAWFLGYQKFNEQRETVATENDQLAMEVSQLRAKVSKKAQVECPYRAGASCISVRASYAGCDQSL